MMKMATYVAERGLLWFCLVAFIVSAKALKCHSCLGTEQECTLTEVTCPGRNDRCASSITVIKALSYEEHSVTKGCVSSTAPFRCISLSPDEMVQISFDERTCKKDLCNKKTIPVIEAKENEMSCYSCISPNKDCNSETMHDMKCRGRQNKCLDVRVHGDIGEISNINFKGCGEVKCSSDVMFSNNGSSVLVKCCNENLCNSDVDFQELDKTPNGVECYSCNTLFGESCSDATTTQCYGDLTACYELAGIKTGDGKPTLSVLKGCATPNICDSLLLPLLHNVRSSRVQCCNGNLCNNNFTDENLQASGYFPGMVIQSYPANQATYNGKDSGVKRPQYFYNPVKTGHNSNNSDSGDGSSVKDVPTVSSPTTGDKQNYFNSVSWNSTDNNGHINSTSSPSDELSSSLNDSEVDIFSIFDTSSEDDSNLTTTSQTPPQLQGSRDGNSYGSKTNATSPPSDGLNSSAPSGSTSNQNLSTEMIQDSGNDNLGQQNQTSLDNSDLNSTTDGDVFFTGSEVDMVSVINIFLEDDSNLTTNSEMPTQLQGSRDVNSYGNKTNVSSPPSDGLNSSSPSGSTSNQNLSHEIIQGSGNDNLGQQNQTSVDDSDPNSTTYGDVFFTGSEVDMVSLINIFLEEDSNLTTTSETPTQLQGSQDVNSYGSKTNVTSLLSDGLNSAPSGSKGNQNISTEITKDSVNDNLGQENQNSPDNSDLNSTTDGDVFLASNKTDTFVILVEEEDDSSLSATSQGPAETKGSWKTNSTSESSDGLNSSSSDPSDSDLNKQITQETEYDDFSQEDQTSFYDIGFNSTDGMITNNSSSENYTVPSTGNYSTGANNSLTTAQQGQTLGGETTLLSSNSNSNISNVQRVPNYSSGDHTGEKRGNSSKVSSGTSPPREYGNGKGSHSIPKDNEYGSSNASIVNSPKQNPPVSKNTSTGYGAYHGNGTNRSNSSTPNNGLFSTPMSSEVNTTESNNGTNLNSSNLSMSSSGGNNSSGNSSNVSSGSSSLGGDGNNNGSHSMATDNGGDFKNGSSSGNTSSINNPNQASPVSNNNSTENGFSHGNGTSRSNSSTENNGDASNPMPSELNNNGSSNGTSSNSSNSSNLSMTPTGGGYNGSSSSNNSTLGGNQNGSFVGVYNGSDPGPTGDDHSNGSSHNPHMMSPGGFDYNSTLNDSYGINATDGNSSGNYSMPWEESPYWDYDFNMLPPELSGSPDDDFFGSGYSSNYSMYGTEGNRNDSNVMSTGGNSHGELNSNPNNSDSSYWNSYPNENGSITYHLPSGLNVSTNGNYSSIIIHMLSNLTGLSPTNVSQRLNGIDLSKPSNFFAVLSEFPGLNLNQLSPEVKAAIFGNIHAYSNGPGFNHHMKPPKHYNLIKILSIAANTTPALLSQKLNGVNMSNPRNLASVLLTIPSFDDKKLPDRLREAIFGHHSNGSHVFPNTSGYNNNAVPPTWNISNLVNNSYFLEALSNMTNISIDVISQKLDELSKDSQGNLTALLYSFKGFDLDKFSPDLRKEIIGKDTGGYNYSMVPPGSTYNNSDFDNISNNGTYDLEFFPGNNASDGNITYYSGAPSLRSKAEVFSIVFTITLLLLNWTDG